LVFLGLLVFVAIVLYIKVPAKVTAALDARSARIKADLEEARRLRDEAKAVLAGYEKKRSEAESEAAAIIEQAKREAEALSAEARVRIEDYVTRRTKAVEQRIAQAETQAIAEVRSRAIDVAAAAAGRILVDKAKGKTGDDLIERAIESVRQRIN
jgi:F-type H+-transporting ATPase subunit b